MRKLKKLLLSILFASIVVSASCPIQNIVGMQDVVQAASVKLNKSALSLNVGQSSTLKVSGTKSKVTWSSSNKSIATVSSKGKVTAKQAGSATIKAKVGKKTLKCKVTVKERFSATEATKKISVTLQDTGNGVVAILKNNNKVTVSLVAKLVYYSNGKMIDTASDSNYAFESGAECALFFHAPYDNDYNNVAYDDYKITLTVEKGTNLICGQDGIDVESDFGADNVMAEVSNNSGKNFEFIIISVVFYDANDNAIGYEYSFAQCLTDGSVDYLTFDFPYDSNYDTIYPNSYKVYVNNAYTYTWM